MAARENKNVHQDSRTSSPSLSERVRSITTLRSRFSSSRVPLADDSEVEPTLVDESDNGLSTPERARSAASIHTKDYILDHVQSSRPLSDRIRMLSQVAENVVFYQLPLLMSIWNFVQDLYGPEAHPEARKACFNLATSISMLSDIPLETQRQLYHIVIIPAPIETLDEQVKSLKSLTRKGSRTLPFSPDIGKALIKSLKQHFSSVIEVRRRHKASGGRDPIAALGDRGLSNLFILLANIESQNPGAIQADDQKTLLKELFAIAEKTTSPRDMKGVQTVLGPIVRASGIPEDLRSRCVELLCAMSGRPEVKDDSKATLLFLLRSDCKQEILQILLNNLPFATSDRNNSIVSGSLLMLLSLIKNKGEDELPLVTLDQLFVPFSKVHYGSRSTRCAALQTIADLLSDSNLRTDVIQSDWSYMMDTILTATGDEIYEPGQKEPLSIESTKKSVRSSSTPSNEAHKDQLAKQQKLADAIFTYLQNIASSLNSLWMLVSYQQKQLISRFYNELVYVLPEDCLLQLLNYVLSFKSSKMDLDFDLLFPQDPVERPLPKTQYYECMDELIDMFMFQHRIRPKPYGRIMTALREDLQECIEVRDIVRVKKLESYVQRLLREFDPVQQSGWEKAVELAKTVAVLWKISRPRDFAPELGFFRPLLYSKADDEDTRLATAAEEGSLYTAHRGLANVTLALVEVFLEYLPVHTTECTMLFDQFLQIASDKALSPSLRLPALRLLARIRCDKNGWIFVVKNSDSLGLAPYLRRTEQTRHKLATFKDETTQRSPSAHKTQTTTEASRELRRSRKSIDSFNKPVPKPPLWMYPGGPGLPSEPPKYPSDRVWVYNKNLQQKGSLKMGHWLHVVLDILQNEKDWEVYSYVVVHLPSQLTNSSLFIESIPAIKMLRNIVTSQLLDGRIQEPPTETHVKKGDVAFCLMQTIMILLGYAEHFSQGEQDEIVKTILHGIGTWDRTGQTCIQALSVACYALPISIKRMFGAILLKLERYITHMNLTVDILEFLGGIARMRDIHIGLEEDQYRKVFAICFKYLEFAREQRSKLELNSKTSKDNIPDRLSSTTSQKPMQVASETADKEDRHKHLPQYVFVLAYHVVSFWFLAIKLPDRSKYVSWISSQLAWKDIDGVERMEEQSQVTHDMMMRTAYSDMEESKPMISFKETDGPVQTRSWIVGSSIVTIETAATTGLSQITKRQISGTTYSTYLQQVPSLPAHHIAMQEEANPMGVDIYPHHVILQLTTTAAPSPSILAPIPLPDDAVIKRALDTFDRMDTVDGYRIGVLFVHDGQSTQKEILGNDYYYHHFKRFMDKLGTKVALKGANFNTQGLDKVSDQDGEYTYAWRDRLVEIVYHVPVLMPNLEHDREFNNKKLHVGNNFVTIVWNESGLPFDFDTIPSQFNSVNIVITPEHRCSPSEQYGQLQPDPSDPSPRTYVAPREGDDCESDDPKYTIQTLTHQTFPQLSSCASAKLLPLSRLPAFVRQTALNSAIFSNVWSHREDGEYVSSWRNRLREISNLRDRYANTGTEAGGTRKGREYGPGVSFKGKLEMGGMTGEEGLISSLDFSLWAGNVPATSDAGVGQSTSASRVASHESGP